MKMRALSIRQPYAELILRGIKTIEYRTFATRIIDERFYIYASKKKWPQQPKLSAWSRDLVVPKQPLPQWMSELAKLLILDKLPSGVIVGTAIISHCTQSNGEYHWHLKDVERLARPREPKRHPQPAWFLPF